jgi:hypothetical protein
MSEQQTYALPLMIGFAVAGGLIGLVAESAMGGADPAFAATLGGALGGVFGRAVWRRRRDALRNPAEASFGRAMALLMVRVAACAILGVAVVGSLGGASSRAVTLDPIARGILGAAGAIGLVLTSAAEARRIARLRDLTPRKDGDTHGA